MEFDRVMMASNSALDTNPQMFVSPAGERRGSKVLSRPLVAIAFSLHACLALAAQIEVGEIVSGHPFRKYSVVDSLNRKINFFISESPDAAPMLPLTVFVQGTGCSSHFRQDNGRISTGIGRLMYEVFNGRAKVLIVEKPGVELFDDQGERPMQEACRPAFFVEHTLDRWAEAIAASIRAAHTLASVDGTSTLVVGHSEGGMVAVRVSNALAAVTHVASLAGGGPNHLYTVAEYIRGQDLDPERLVFDCWDQVQKDPQSTTKFCFDHPFRHLSGFYRTSLTHECLRSKAQLYLVHGSEDVQNSVDGFDMMRAELAAAGRNAVFERLKGADHALNLPGQVTPEGLVTVFGRLAGWFLGE